jgi:hypothetical protein
MTLGIYLSQIMEKVQSNGMHRAFFIFTAEMLRVNEDMDILVCEEYINQMWFDVLEGEQAIPYCEWEWRTAAEDLTEEAFIADLENIWSDLEAKGLTI